MPSTKISDIKSATLGNTQLSAVYKGSVLIWKEGGGGGGGDTTLTASYWRDTGSSGGCTRPLRQYRHRLEGTHTVTDPGRQFQGSYLSEGSTSRWIDGAWLDGSTVAPNVPFTIASGLASCFNQSAGQQFNAKGRLRWKLSDGTVTEWSEY